MKKLYYTNPLKAAWMVREFGVKLQRTLRCGKREEIYYTTWAELLNTSIFNYLEHSVAYIHPDSLPIFEADFEDLVYCADFPGAATQFIFDSEHGEKLMSIFKTCNFEEKEIIQRQGKAFFMPEVEG